MKAAFFYGPRDIRVEETPTPKIGSGEVLLKIESCGICGGDLERFEGRARVEGLPRILGHEFSGTVAEIGPEVEGFEEGDKVVVYPHPPCGKCYYCVRALDNLCENRKTYGIDFDGGGYAEYIKIFPSCLFKVPKEIPLHEAGDFLIPVGTPFHALKMAGARLGDFIAIYGVGALGLNAIQIAKSGGMKVIAVERVKEKLELAKRFGADYAIHSAEEDPVDKIKELTGSLGADISLEVAGILETTQQAIDSVKKRGKVLLIGTTREQVPIATISLVEREINVLGVSGMLRSEIPQVIDLVAQGKVNITVGKEKVPLEEISGGFEIRKRKHVLIIPTRTRKTAST